MPIPLAKIKEASRPLHERIQLFMEKTEEDKAYSVEEIIAGVFGTDIDSTTMTMLFMEDARWAALRAEYEEALATLVQADEVREFSYESVTYYAHHRRWNP